MPRTTPRQNRERVTALGGESVRVIVTGHTYDDAAAAALRDAHEQGATLLPAFDDPRTIAGQGTVVKEAVEQLGRAPDAVVVPVGGGGLLAGTLTWLRARHPRVMVIGAEPAGAASMAAALRAGSPQRGSRTRVLTRFSAEPVRVGAAWRADHVRCDNTRSVDGPGASASDRAEKR